MGNCREAYSANLTEWNQEAGGFPFMPAAAKEFGINIKIEYYGCIIRTLYSDEFGLKHQSLH